MKIGKNAIVVGRARLPASRDDKARVCLLAYVEELFLHLILHVYARVYCRNRG